MTCIGVLRTGRTLGFWRGPVLQEYRIVKGGSVHQDVEVGTYRNQDDGGETKKNGDITTTPFCLFLEDGCLGMKSFDVSGPESSARPSAKPRFTKQAQRPLPPRLPGWMMLSIGTGIPLLLQNTCLERRICRKTDYQSLRGYRTVRRKCSWQQSVYLIMGNRNRRRETPPPHGTTSL